MTNIEDLIGIHAMKMATTDSNLHIAPKIPQKKLTNAIEAYGENVDPGRVVALYDATIFGSATDGFFITPAGIYFSEGINNEANAIMFSEIEEITHIDDVFRISMTDDYWHLRTSWVTTLEFLSFIRAIIEAREEGLIHETDKFVILEDMSDEVKLAYIDIIIHMIYTDDGMFDQRELAELHTLMAQLDFGVELRRAVRTRLANPVIHTGDLLEHLEATLPAGSHQGIHLSLIKDLIRIHRATDETGRGVDNVFISGLASCLDISNEQIELLEQACQFDEDIFEGRIDDNEIRDGAAALAAAAAACGVPLAAVYLSGSVMGLSAAGITSGLAALGLGGVMGLGGMVTGLGVVAMLGGGVFIGVRWLLGSTDDSSKRYALRESMLAEVLRNNQLTMNHLFEDINDLQSRLLDEVRQSALNREKIDKLARDLSIFSQAMDVLQDKGIDIFDELRGGTDVKA